MSSWAAGPVGQQHELDRSHNPPVHLGACTSTCLSWHSPFCQACAPHIHLGCPEALMRKGRALSWVRWGWGETFRNQCDTVSLLVEDEDFSILLAALESRCVAVIRSWACQGPLSCVVSSAESPSPQGCRVGSLGTWVVEVVALSPHLGH